MQDPVAEIKSRLDIVDVVADYVQLKKLGANYKALSPFVHEKTPSFVVSPEKQIAYCFSSNRGGDMFKFIMEIENVGFRDAIEILARKAGITIEKSEYSKAQSDEKTKIFEANTLANEYFQHVLWNTDAGQAGRDYLESRGVDRALASSFGLGVSLDAWDMLSRALLQKSVTDATLIDAGLVVQREGKSGYYDKFRDRLMFPIANSSGLIVGFGARGMSSDATPKYLNTAETKVYHKSHVLYNYDRAKGDIKKNNLAIVVEGYMDVISSYKTSIRNVVASSGTALTSDHLQMIRRLTNRVAFAFDSDSAGVAAAQRAISMALEADMEVLAVVVPNGKDADDCIKEDPSVWEDICLNPRPYIDFILDVALAQHDVSTAEGKKNISKDVLTHVVMLTSAVQRDYYIQRLADELGVSASVLRDELVLMTAKERPARVQPKKYVPQEVVFGKEDYVYGILLMYPDLFAVFDSHVGDDFSFLPEGIVSRISDLRIAWEKGETRNQEYTAETAPLVLRLEELYHGLSKDDYSGELCKLVDSLRNQGGKKSLTMKIAEMEKAERDGDMTKVAALKEEITQMLLKK